MTVLAVEVPTAVVTLDTSLLTVLTGVVLPIVVGLVTKRVTRSDVQRVLLLVLSLIGGALTSIIAADGTFDLGNVLLNVAICYFTGQTTYSTVLKPTGLAKALQGAGGVITAADPAKEAALAGDVTTATAAGNVLAEQPVIPVPEAQADEVEVGEPAVVDTSVEGEPEAEVPEDDGTDVVPYDEDPDDEVPVIDPAALRVTEGP
jgi:hypothetical protein